ncbi:alcohol dehydrogenase, GroES family [Desulfosarcina variabilis str. Montpellier]|uniref:zinc-dependent alcohol dehydrogenase n=1 Tax=Desulfosarcina variabilis TaxID=2300 RepID=UPI003AFA9DC6
MLTSTRAVVATGPGKLEMRTYPLPEIGDEDGILKVELAGVCGSDPGIFKGKSARAPRPWPIILGHEIVGRVHRMGKAAQQRHGVKEGDRVIIEYAFGCGMCKPCLTGRYTLCERFYNYGSMISCASPPHLFGAYADYLYIHPRAMVHKIGEDLSPEEGVLICAVVGNGVRWLRHIGGVTIGQPVAIVGPGQQGLAAVAVAKEAGAGPIVVVGRASDTERLEMARQFGADVTINMDQDDPQQTVAAVTHGTMADLVMDASGHPDGARLALDLAGVGASVILPGLYGAQTEVPLLLDRAVFREIRLIGVFSHDCRAVTAAIEMVKRKGYPFKDMISHRLPLEKARHALALVGGDLPGETCMKVVLDPSMSA